MRTPNSELDMDMYNRLCNLLSSGMSIENAATTLDLYRCEVQELFRKFGTPDILNRGFLN